MLSEAENKNNKVSLHLQRKVKKQQQTLSPVHSRGVAAPAQADKSAEEYI